MAVARLEQPLAVLYKDTRSVPDEDSVGRFAESPPGNIAVGDRLAVVTEYLARVFLRIALVRIRPVWKAV